MEIGQMSFSVQIPFLVPPLLVSPNVPSPSLDINYRILQKLHRRTFWVPPVTNPVILTSIAIANLQNRSAPPHEPVSQQFSSGNVHRWTFCISPAGTNPTILTSFAIANFHAEQITNILSTNSELHDSLVVINVHR